MDKTSSFETYQNGGTTLELQLTILIVLTARRWRSLADEKLRSINQSSARMEAMAAILNSPALSSQVEIAKRLRIEGPTITRMIDTLQKDELVERVPHPTDRRTKQLRLTAEGEERLHEVFDLMDPLREQLFEGFTREELEQHFKFLQRLMDRLDSGKIGT